ncbi:MAG: methyltransferase domain-containing protein [Candidatus Shapirobacteria bacterium]|nr:methyltransferase domain-containing protein [Candidatus Shapirobacteria bacterium]MDD4383222.1 methyltransferase domain-containing protein [Candidatus Shapirobacteria bacterium]
MDFDYNKYYKNKTKDFYKYEKKIAFWKAKHLLSLINDTTNDKSIIEIGTGNGEVLNNFTNFKVKIGTDISSEAIKRNVYVKESKNIKIIDKHINRNDINNSFISFKNVIKIPKEKLFLLIFDAQKKTVFDNKSVDYVLACDILEHVKDPNQLLREISRIGNKFLFKIPIENCLLTKLSLKINNIKYEINHPSGHIHCWNLKQIHQLLKNNNIKIKKEKFIPINNETIEGNSIFKKIIINTILTLDKITMSHNMFSKWLLGGNVFILGE